MENIFRKLEKADGTPIIINTRQIVMVAPHEDDGSIIYLSLTIGKDFTQRVVYVKEDFKLIERMLLVG